MIPLISGLIGGVLSALGNLVLDLRHIFLSGGHNYISALTGVIEFLLILIVLKLLVTDDWGDAVWVALIALFFLYLLLTLFAELAQFSISV